MTEEFKKVERKNHNFKEDGKEVVGILKERVQSQYQGDDYILDVDGKDVFIYGKTALQTKMTGIATGTKIKIVYIDDKKSEKTGRTYEDYDVYTSR